MFVLPEYVAEGIKAGKGLRNILESYSMLEAEVTNGSIELEAGNFLAGADALGIAALPFVAVYGYYRAIKWTQEAAEEEVAKENFQSGFSHGFMSGLLGWKRHHLLDRFAREKKLKIYQRDSLNAIWQNSYNHGLLVGYGRAADFGAVARKGFLKACRKLSGAQKGNWDRRDQINYLVEMAAAFRRKFLTW